MKTTASFLALAFLLTVSAFPRSTNRCANEPSGTILPSLQCQFYVICQNGQEHQVRCQPMGTFFDVNRMVCDSRPNVTCWDGVITTTTTTTSTTTTTTAAPVTTAEPTTAEPTTEAIETTTEQVITEEITTEEVSEATTDEEIGTEESTTGGPAPTTAAPPNFTEMCRGVVVEILPHPTDCTQFVVCVLGRYQVEQCDEGHIFYPVVRVCGVGNPDQCEA